MSGISGISAAIHHLALEFERAGLQKPEIVISFDDQLKLHHMMKPHLAATRKAWLGNDEIAGVTIRVTEMDPQGYYQFAWNAEKGPTSR